MEVFSINWLNEHTVEYRGGRRCCTWDADVTDLQVGRKVFRTRLELFERLVGYLKAAAGTTRAQRGDVSNDVDRTADVAVVFVDTIADLHTPVSRRQHQYNVTGGAVDVESFPPTELPHHCTLHEK